MNAQGILLLTANFTAIGLLPLLFFKRDGKFNLMWWATGAPFFVAIGSVLASFYGLGTVVPALQPLVLPPIVSALLTLVALLLSLVSIALIAFTLGSHRIPIALWHQDNDAPAHIVTWGAYAKIRHPFYASFLLAFLAAILYCPQLITFLCGLYAVLVLNITAQREEQRLANSAYGAEYRDYMSRTGRFLPRSI